MNDSFLASVTYIHNSLDRMMMEADIVTRSDMLTVLIDELTPRNFHKSLASFNIEDSLLAAMCEPVHNEKLNLIKDLVKRLDEYSAGNQASNKK